MKSLFLIAGTALFLVSCAGQPETPETTESIPAIAEGPKDPVCKMSKEDTWTEYTATGTDTTWFCSEFCKDAYAANPAKYDPLHGSEAEDHTGHNHD